VITGLSGSLVSRQFAESGLEATFGGQLGERDRDRGRRQLQTWCRGRAAALGPASSLRTMLDRGAAPLMAILGYEAGSLGAGHGPAGVPLGAPAGVSAGLLVCPWGVDPDRLWREAVREGIRVDARWCFVFNGVALRLVDAARTYARRHVEIDLELAAGDERLFAVLWGFLHARALAPAAGPLADLIVEASERHGAGVRTSLGEGVRSSILDLLNVAGRHDRTGCARLPAGPGLLEPALVVIYRILFLLFAEARGLVPVWHPLYRGSYSIHTLAERAGRDPDARGLWEALEAIARLAGRGCEAGDLKVAAFNGGLFSRSATAGLDRRSRRRRRHARDPRDRTLGRVLATLTTRETGAGRREHISYADLGVEQLGAVYERVLDYAPAPGETGVRLEPVGRRKATGSFYTPRALTGYLVRRTLHPLVQNAAPDAILSLRVLDLAMGSGAFLVEACRYLASSYETALVRTGDRSAADITPADRAEFRRTVAQRCLYGVDRNPMAVQLGRLSLWLATLAADRPLTFLDHNLRVGDSLVGASVEDVLRQPPPASGRAPAGPLPLIDATALEAAVGLTVTPRRRIAIEAGDDLASVQAKQRLFAGLASDGAPLARWRSVADLWCASAFWRAGSRPPGAGEFWALADGLLARESALAARVAAPRLEQARRIAADRRFFHWRLEFPEAFHDARGAALPRPGFDAIIGNPPWEMLRADEGPSARRSSSRDETAGLRRFIRSSGVYRLAGDGHVNLYQLFLERALALARDGGRVGLVLPFGLAVDRGSSALRGALLARCDTDSLISFDNREAVFPIHRGYRFLLVTTTIGGETGGMRCRFGERSAEALDSLPDDGGGAGAFPIRLGRAAVERIGGPGLVIPELRAPIDLAIAEKASAVAPPLGDADGWGARFGRELNATDDRRHFGPPGVGLPIVEGKLVRPFRVDLAGARHSIPSDTAGRLLDRARTFGRPRLAFRDVASATNERSLIAAVLPAGVVTTHTLLCLKTRLDAADERVLCALLNSSVANYLVRQRMGTHVTATIAGDLPVPRPAWGTAAHGVLDECAAHLAVAPDDGPAAARLDAAVAELYDLTTDELARVLETFPLVDAARREAAMAEYGRKSRVREGRMAISWLPRAGP